MNFKKRVSPHTAEPASFPCDRFFLMQRYGMLSNPAVDGS